MAEGVENCCVLVCFLTPEYEESKNCKKELTYAVQLGKPIVPCLLKSKGTSVKWKPSKWLGLTIADLVYLNLTTINDSNFEEKCQQLMERISSAIPVGSLSTHSVPSIEKNIDDESTFIECPFTIVEPISEGPQIDQDHGPIVAKVYSCEGDSTIHLHNQSKEIQCSQDLYSKNGKFYNSFTVSRLLMQNRSSDKASVVQFFAEYEGDLHGETRWIPCDVLNNDPIHIQGNECFICCLTIRIEVEGSPGVDHEHRSRAHRLLPQPLKLKVSLQDQHMKYSHLIVEQVKIIRSFVSQSTATISSLSLRYRSIGL